MLELIIERGMQLLQTSEGEKLPRVIETVIRQRGGEPGHCQFTMFVDDAGCCKYQRDKQRLITPRGKHLRNVKVLKYKDAEGPTIPAKVLCECTVAFFLDTVHKKHFENLVTA